MVMANHSYTCSSCSGDCSACPATAPTAACTPRHALSEVPSGYKCTIRCSSCLGSCWAHADNLPLLCCWDYCFQAGKKNLWRPLRISSASAALPLLPVQSVCMQHQQGCRLLLVCPAADLPKTHYVKPQYMPELVPNDSITH